MCADSPGHRFSSLRAAGLFFLRPVLPVQRNSMKGGLRKCWEKESPRPSFSHTSTGIIAVQPITSGKPSPASKVAASAQAAAIVARPSAQMRITELGRTAIPVVKTLAGLDESLLIDEPFRPFDVDIVLHDGQMIQVDKDTTVEVLATPGHTRDHLSYYIPERKILIGGEAAGCLEPGGSIDVEFLADYEAYLASLTRLLAIPAEVFTQGHNYLFVGQDSIKAYLEGSIKAAEDFAARVHELLQAEGGSIERVVHRIKVEQHDPKPGPKQPDEACLLNLTAQVTHLATKNAANRKK